VTTTNRTYLWRPELHQLQLCKKLKIKIKIKIQKSMEKKGKEKKRKEKKRKEKKRKLKLQSKMKLCHKDFSFMIQTNYSNAT
jgi:hypothetical protein